MTARLQDLPFDPTALSPALQLALDANFGSAARWHAAFAAMGKAVGSAPACVQLVYQPRRGTLVNQTTAGLSTAPAGGVNLLTMDLRGPAGSSNAAAGPADRVDAFMAQIDWPAVHGRYAQAVNLASEALGASAEGLGASGASANAVGHALVIDVRRAGAFAQARTLIAGALWRDPAKVASWLADLPTDRSVLVYCVHGHEVSRATAVRLHAAGVKVRYLQGGIEGWQAAQGALDHKPAGPAP